MAQKRFPKPYKWEPQNKEKYKGDYTNIVIRSSWEQKFFLWCDRTPSVISYSSEETVIPYICKIDNTAHKYFVDAKMVIKTKDGSLKTYLVEIKPLAQTYPPKYPGRQTKRYITEVETFVKNQSKWEAAEQYAKQRGYTFIILTEKELGMS